MTQTYAATEPAPAEVEAMRGPLLLEFGAPWCGHCRAAQGPLAEAFAAHPGVQHLKIEDGRGRPLGRAYGVKLWPTFVFLRDGREVERLVRPVSTGPLADALARLESGTAQA